MQNSPDIDLILMDIEIPELDGNETTRKIREFNNDGIIIA
jgi:CheY-like chemotaxis protein